MLTPLLVVALPYLLLPPQVHMSVLVSAADRPPSEMLSELAALAAARELGMDHGKEPALVWRIIRQPDDWEALVDAVYSRVDQVWWVKGGVVCRCGMSSSKCLSTTAAVLL